MPKISSLTAATALTGLETLPVVQSGTTKKATASQVLAASPFINGSDIYATMVAEIAALGANGGSIHIPAGTYTCSDTIVLTKPVHLYGDAGIGNVATATKITFAASKSGIRIEYPFQGVGSIIERLALYGSSGTAGHGIVMLASATIQDCQIRSFKENGIEILADVTATPPSNSNGFQLNRIIIAECGGDGVRTHGGDANGGTGIAIIVGDCGGWGINDDGFLGNTWIGCQSDGCDAPYTTSQATARSVWVGCYSESGVQGPSVFSQWTLVLGGLHAAGLSGGLYLINNSISSFVQSFAAGSNTGYASYATAAGLVDLTYHTDGFSTQLFKWHAGLGSWIFSHANSDSRIYVVLTADSTAITDEITSAAIPAGHIAFPRGIWMPTETSGVYRNITDTQSRLEITDGVTAPATRAGVARIYVDTADGDLKVKFGDGTVKTIVVDT